MIRLVARLLRRVRAGEGELIWNAPAIAKAPASITLTSPAFAAGAVIPRQHAGKGIGENLSPALAWDGVPVEAKELVLVIEDPDAPLPRPFVHAIVLGIQPQSHGLAEGELSSGEVTLGRNSFGRRAYAGPRALPGHGPHTYAFQLFALAHPLSVGRAPNRAELLRALDGAVLARGRLDGVFERR
jgi:Raf kinase inhibitor-like YbhB/YbcL family protein